MSCPVCGDDTAPRWRPFCSRRCADVDLGRWMTGRYAIPAAPADEEEDPSPEAPRPDDRLH